MVNTNSAQSKEREFEFTKDDFAFVRGEVYNHAGIALAEHKVDMVYSRLSRRLRSLGLQRFSEYRDYLQSNPDELVQFVNALTTNLTHFFRENHHFDYIKSTVIPELMNKNANSRRMRFWCAGCSTGEEPYSLAMTLCETITGKSNWDIKILATDLDTQVLDKAKSGRYDAERLKDVGRERTERWFDYDGMHKAYVAKPALKSLITFKQLNLMNDWPMKGPFDVIFCRNVVIYFDKATQKRLFGRYVNLLEDDGVLMLGHSESLGDMIGHFKTVGRTIFRKKPGARA